MRFSIVTPSFNQGEFIERTLLSVRCQSAPGVVVDHYIADGGSTDDTLDVLRRHEGIAWVSEPDGGQADAVNKAILATQGDIIGWLNSDDVYYPGALAVVAGFFAVNPEVDVVYGMADWIDVQDRPIGAYPTQAWNLDRLMTECFICQPALFFRRRVVERHGLLDASLQYCMDYEYWLRLGRSGAKFAYLERRLAGSRMYAENKTLGARVAVHREIIEMFKRGHGRVPFRWLINYAHAVADGRQSRSERPLAWQVELAVWAIWAVFRWDARQAPRLLRGLVRRFAD